MNILPVFLLIFFLNSCASRFSDDEVREAREKDLLREFSLEKNTFNKFQIQKINKKHVEVTKKSSIKKVKQKKISERINKSKSSLKLKKKHLVKVIKKKKILTKFVYPQDYPEEMIKLEKESKKIWDKFKPVYFPGERASYSVHYLGIKVGTIDMLTGSMVQIANRKTFFLRAELKSADYYDFIYSLDDFIESYVDSKTFLPIKYSLKQRESGQTLDDLQLFDHDKLKTYYWYRRTKKSKLKKDYKENFIPKYFQDSYSAFLFLRGLPLEVGSSYSIPIVNRSKYWILKVKFKKYEKIKILGKYTKTIVLKAESYFPGVMKKKGDIKLWYTHDAKKILVKFEAKVKLGSITGEILKYTGPGTKR